MEERGDYLVPDFEERLQSQLPALHLLMAMGWQYLTPDEALRARGGRTAAVLLDEVLLESLRARCRFEFKGRLRPFTEAGLLAAVQTLKAFRVEGGMHENEQVYDLLSLGHSVPQTVEGDTKSFAVRFVDWEDPAANALHCTAEFRVERIGRERHYVPDIVLFVNGIPMAVIECKRSAYDDPKRKPMEEAIKQQLRYQEKEGIPQLYLYAQVLLGLCRTEAKYGTTATEEKYWGLWREAGLDERARSLIAWRPSEPELERMLSEPFAPARQRFLDVLRSGREPTEQDRLLAGVCRPERFLELVHRFVLYDDGVKKIARYQQYFTVLNTLARVGEREDGGRRKGGVVWHAQGSGKSLTMVMLAKSLALVKEIPNPKIVLVTDRIDLDSQILGTFRACGIEPKQATTGVELARLLRDERTEVVTTLVHKFTAAAGHPGLRKASANTFVLVDEGHRTQYGDHHARMQLALNDACFIAFTGTPLAKSAKRNTFAQFGELLQPVYTIRAAMDDHAVVPLLYEARDVPQHVDARALDEWFEKMTGPLTVEQKADLKRKFTTRDQLGKAQQLVRSIAWDVSLHFSTMFKGTGLKGQLVAPDKATALLYHRFLGEFGMVSSEVLISGLGTQEGEVEGDESPEVREFWTRMMDRFGTEKQYNKLLIAAYKNGDEPDIIIVVDKLLTGFDAPVDTVLYLARRLKSHTLLQAIMRVNRLHDAKEFGYILDYRGIIEDLHEAFDFYARLADYDPEDLRWTVIEIAEVVARLPETHSALWGLFTGVGPTKDQETYERHLFDAALRVRFYDHLGRFARTLSVALSSHSFLERTPADLIERYKRDLKFFQNLRGAVQRRYQEKVDFGAYEAQVRKLVDIYVGSADVESLGEPINLLDATARQSLLDDQRRSTASKADTIAFATRRVIEEEMRRDPAFYGKFSALLEKAIREFHEKRIRELDYLREVAKISEKVVNRTDEELPTALRGTNLARRFYGCVREPLASYGMAQDAAAQLAVEVEARLRPHKIRDWRSNGDALKRMQGEIDDLLFDLKGRIGVDVPLDRMDEIIERCIEVAIANED